ncbi:hypothetical protein BGZ65_013003, partial [Modicella reniformis]
MNNSLQDTNTTALSTTYPKDSKRKHPYQHQHHRQQLSDDYDEDDEDTSSKTESDLEASNTVPFNHHSEEVRKLRWRIDKRLVPMLALLYLCSFLDRSNIGNAKVAGLVEDLQLKPGMYNLALSIFYVGYVI